MTAQAATQPTPSAATGALVAPPSSERTACIRVLTLTLTLTPTPTLTLTILVRADGVH